MLFHISHKSGLTSHAEMNNMLTHFVLTCTQELSAMYPTIVWLYSLVPTIQFLHDHRGVGLLDQFPSPSVSECISNKTVCECVLLILVSKPTLVRNGRAIQVH